jgi:hypothetical protein
VPSLPLYAPIQSRDGTLTKGAFLKNAFVEKVGEAVDTFRRPGLLLYGSTTAALGRGMVTLTDYAGVDRLFAGFGGNLYSSASLRAAAAAGWVISSGTSGRITSAAGNILYQPAFVPFRGYVFAIGSGASSLVAEGSKTRFMVAYSADKGRNWNVLLDVASAASGYPTATTSFHAAVVNSKIYIVSDGTGSAALRTFWSSPDGVVWTSLGDHGDTGDINKILAHSDGKLYLFYNQATPAFRTSADGISWASPTGSTAPSYHNGANKNNCGIISFNGSLYVIGGSQATNGVDNETWKSTDNGVTWAEVGANSFSSNDAYPTHCFMDGPVCYAHLNSKSGGAFNDIYYSTDFSTWTLFKSEATILGDSGASTRAYDIATIIDGTIIGSFSSSNEIYYYLDSTSSTGSLVSIASVIGQFFDFAQNYARTKIAFKSEGAAYSLDTTYNVVTQVSDADYPADSVRGIVYLNGVFYVMDPDGNVIGSDNEDFTAWTATNLIAAEFEPDGGVCLAKYGFYVVAFGQYSTEFFFDAGNATGSPLSPVQNGVLGVGCADGDTVAVTNDTVIFVAQAKSGGQAIEGTKFIAQLDGTSYKRLSSPDIDRILLADDFADVEAVVFAVAGHSYYCLNLGTSALSLVYDIAQQTWTVWDRRRTSFTQTMSNVVTTNGTATATITYTGSDGDVGVITAGTATHTSLNGTYNMIVPASGTLCWALSGTSYAGTATATITGTGYTATDFGIVGACVYANKQLAQDATNGKIYALDRATYQDDSIYMDWQARMVKLDMDNNKMKYAALADFVSDRATGNVLMRLSDDDSQSWTKYRPKSLAGAQTRFNRGGNFRRRVYDFRITDNIPVRAQRVEYSIDEGAE